MHCSLCNNQWLLITCRITIHRTKMILDFDKIVHFKMPRDDDNNKDHHFGSNIGANPGFATGSMDW